MRRRLRVGAFPDASEEVPWLKEGSICRAAAHAELMQQVALGDTGRIAKCLALLGSTISAAAGYGLGRLLWRDAVRRLAGARIERLNEGLSRNGLVATAVVRVVPVAPFAVVNMVAGASHMGLRDFVVGTALGMAPGTLALAFFGEQAAAVLRDPTPGSIVAAALGGLVVIGLAVLGRRLLGAGEAGEEGSA